MSRHHRFLRHRGVRAVVLACVACLGIPPHVLAAAAPDLTEMSLEALMDLEVTSVSRRAESLSDAAAAVFVITAEDLRRSGVTTIPEALRMVPGVHVGKIDANKWAITARGFSGRFANKLLVLLDGRTVYTPLFSGVYWDVQDTLLEDVERIEVIRGPGATLWGANAVNGVINIITRSAHDTVGGLVAGGGGTEERGFASARYGAGVGDAGAIRVYAKGFARDGGVTEDGDDTADDWRAVRGGFRSDWRATSADAVTLQGDLYRGTSGTTAERPTVVPPFSTVVESDDDVSGGNLLARWTRSGPDGDGFTLQAYIDRTRRDEETLLEETRDTFDLDFQHAVSVGAAHHLVWGLGYRLTRDEIDGGTSGVADPDRRTDDLWSGFVQDDLTLVPDRFRLIVGTKVEHNDYSGYEFQPTARVVWTPNPRHTVWASVSRAVRTPSRGETDGTIDLQTVPPGTPANPGPLPVLMQIEKNPDLDAEKVIAVEVGYRVTPTEALSLDASAFVNLYDDLRSTRLGTPVPVPDPSGPHVVQPAVLVNGQRGRGYGVELSAEWRCSERLRLQGAYTYLNLNLEGDGVFGEQEIRFQEGNTPRHQVSVRSQADLSRSVELDLWLRYVDELYGLNDPAVGDYLTLDARLGWNPTDALEIALVGQNLLDGHHLEAVSEAGVGAVSSEVERGVYGKVTWKF